MRFALSSNVIRLDCAFRLETVSRGLIIKYMLAVEVRTIVVPPRISGTQVRITLAFQSRLSGAIDYELTCYGTLRRKQASDPACTIFPCEFKTPIPWVSHLSHSLFASIEVYRESTLLYETKSMIAALKVKTILSGQKSLIELSLDKVSCFVVCTCSDLDKASTRVLFKNLEVGNAAGFFPSHIEDCVLSLDAGYITRRSLYDQKSKKYLTSVPMRLVAPFCSAHITLAGSIGDTCWETILYRTEIDANTGEIVMYEEIDVLDVVAINTLHVLYSFVFKRSRADRFKSSRLGRSLSRQERRKYESGYQSLLSAFTQKMLAFKLGQGPSDSDQFLKILATLVDGIVVSSVSDITPWQLVDVYTKSEFTTPCLNRLKYILLGSNDEWILRRRAHDCLTVVTHKHLLADLIRRYISPAHLSVPEKLGKKQFRQILRDCDEDNVCYVLSIFCRHALALPMAIFNGEAYSIVTTGEKVAPHKWLKAGQGSKNYLHDFLIHQGIPQPTVCDFLWSRLCASGPEHPPEDTNQSSPLSDPSAEMVMNKLSSLLSSALNEGHVGKWCNSLGKPYSLRALFTDLLIYVVLSVDLMPLRTLYGKGTAEDAGSYCPLVDAPDTDSSLCIDDDGIEEDSLDRPPQETDLIFSRGVQKRSNTSTIHYPAAKPTLVSPVLTHHSLLQCLCEEKVAPDVHFMPSCTNDGSGSASLCYTKEPEVLQSMSTETSLSIADLVTDPTVNVKECPVAEKVPLPFAQRAKGLPTPANGENAKHNLISSQVRHPGSHIESILLSDVSCTHEDIVISTLDRTQSSLWKSGSNTVTKQPANQLGQARYNVTALNGSAPSSDSFELRSLVNSSRVYSKLAPQIGNNVTTVINNTIDAITAGANEEELNDVSKTLHKLRMERAITGRDINTVLDTMASRDAGSSTAVWTNDQLRRAHDICMAIAHLRYCTLQLKHVTSTINEDRLNTLLMDAVTNDSIESIVTDLPGPLLSPMYLTFMHSETKSTQTLEVPHIHSESHVANHLSPSLDFSVLHQQLVFNDGIIDSILTKAREMELHSVYRRRTFHASSASSTQRNSDTITRISGFTRSTSRDTNYLFDCDHESRAGSPDICQMLESVKNTPQEIRIEDWEPDHNEVEANRDIGRHECLVLA